MDAATEFTVNTLHAQNRQLRARNEELEELVIQLKGEMGLGQDLPEGLPHLTCYEADMLRILIARKVVTRNAAMMAIYSDRTEMPHEKIVDIWVHRLRRKLGPMGIRIATLWGRGWCLPDATRAILKSMEERS